MRTGKVGIVGMGWVGSSVAMSLLQAGVCKELLLNDIKQEIAEGEALDLTHGAIFLPPCQVRAASLEELTTCDVVIITAGRGGNPGETRLDLLQENIQIVKKISQSFIGFSGILVIVSNPVDVLTYFYQKYTQLPANRVIGTGTLLDTARLRQSISQRIQVDPKNIHAYVVGEHGDSEVILWSQALVGATPLRQWPGWTEELEAEIATEVKRAAQEIIKRKGATNHAIGLVTAHLVQALLQPTRKILCVSSVMNEPTEFKSVATSLPSVVSNNGVEEVLFVSSNVLELNLLKQSVEILVKAIGSVS
jgi:L-lactate dehydrogenase